ncbi:MAG: hypothetical protein ACJAUR_001271 [Ulvibacter sp.]|jgi:hypothetical protein|tara:strand:+ start:232 stop:414 length:183 start_codon:yes stop_codon:yes gene_type:complete
MQAHNIWVCKNGTIEEHLNLSGKSETIWATFYHQLEQSDLQPMLPAEHQEIENCITWILN